MRIAVLTNHDLVNSNYRAYQPLQVLSRRGHEVQVKRKDDPQLEAALLRADVVHVHRIADTSMQRIARALGETGIALVWDNDDDVTAVPRSNPLYAQIGGAKSRAVRAAVTTMVRLATVVTTPSPALAEQYRELGARDVRVLENYLPPEFAKVRPAAHDGFVIAYLAGLEHAVDYQQLRLRDTLLRLLDAHPDLRVLSIGLGLGLPAERYEHIPLAPFLELARIMSHADLGIAPLVDIRWNRARSNVKLKEYAAAGLPWLASPVGPYLGMGEQQGGRLVPDDGWEAAIERLIARPRERRKLAKRAARWAKGEGIERHAHLWEATYRDAIARAREHAPSAVAG